MGQNLFLPFQVELAYISPLVTPVMPRKGSDDRRKGCDELQLCSHCSRKFGSKVRYYKKRITIKQVNELLYLFLSRSNSSYYYPNVLLTHYTS